jgi:hypothetical protein
MVFEEIERLLTELGNATVGELEALLPSIDPITVEQAIMEFLEQGALRATGSPGGSTRDQRYELAR